ncbi:DUF6967 family protein [Novispirillum sp. DQ9]|uniref:DUF6967 family protein n=1 Tax=Novispirillum sp. DQ9 TaxID=3398612 RepID=UPI003C7A72E6
MTMTDDEIPAEGWEAQATVEDLDTFIAPWGREITLKTAAWGSGMRVMQMRIREKRRFTDIDLDEAAVRRLMATMQAWLDGGKAEG